MKVSVNLKRGISYSPQELKGKKVVVRKGEGMFDSFELEVLLEGELIGYVSPSETLRAPETKINKEIYNDLKEDDNEGVISELYETTGMNPHIIPIINFNASDKKEFKLKVSGSIKIYQKKMEVIQEFNQNKEVLLQLTQKEDKLVLFKDGVPAGVCSEKDDEDISLLKKILSDTTIDTKVVDVSKNSYEIKFYLDNEVIEDVKSQIDKEKLSNSKEKAQKFISEERISEIEEYLLSMNIDVKTINEIFDSYIEYPEEIKELIPNPKIKFEDANYLLLDGIVSILEGLPILCYGEKGTGKNIYVETMAWIFNRPLYTCSINSQTDKMDLTGSKTIESSIVDGQVLNNIGYSKEIIIQAMETGGILNMDELNFANPGITGVLHSVCDTRKELNVADYGKVIAHEGFQFIGTMNEGYQGTSELNEALNDRFIPLSFPVQENIIEILKRNCPNAKLGNVTICNKIYKKIRDSIESSDDSLDEKCITTRGFIQALKMSERIPLKRALVRCIADKVRDTEYNNNIVQIIDAYVK